MGDMKYFVMEILY